ncbi:unnamed protein product [Symbiodinium microadriaticum]|nr:unnamed protein product [Symbiodinium microadriaticum]CAE7543198.1 unnamed protein product [Symbiodinium sp. KB8]
MKLYIGQAPQPEAEAGASVASGSKQKGPKLFGGQNADLEVETSPPMRGEVGEVAVTEATPGMEEVDKESAEGVDAAALLEDAAARQKGLRAAVRADQRRKAGQPRRECVLWEDVQEVLDSWWTAQLMQSLFDDGFISGISVTSALEFVAEHLYCSHEGLLRHLLAVRGFVYQHYSQHANQEAEAAAAAALAKKGEGRPAQTAKAQDLKRWRDNANENRVKKRADLKARAKEARRALEELRKNDRTRQQNKRRKDAELRKEAEMLASAEDKARVRHSKSAMQKFYKAEGCDETPTKEGVKEKTPSQTQGHKQRKSSGEGKARYERTRSQFVSWQLILPLQEDVLSTDSEARGRQRAAAPYLSAQSPRGDRKCRQSKARAEQKPSTKEGISQAADKTEDEDMQRAIQASLLTAEKCPHLRVDPAEYDQPTPELDMPARDRQSERVP